MASRRLTPLEIARSLKGKLLGTVESVFENEEFYADPKNWENLEETILVRICELRDYPAYARKSELQVLHSGMAESFADYNRTRLLRRMINSELLEIACLTTEERAWAMLRLAEAIDPTDRTTVRQLWVDCTVYARAHDHIDIVEIAERHLAIR